MTDDITKDLSDSDKLNLILAELSSLREWRAKVDAFIEDRSRDTKPLLGEILKEVSQVRLNQERFETQLRHLGRKFDVLTKDIELRTWQQDLDDRMTGLERRPS